MRDNWEPSKAWKPETIGARYLEMLAKKTERLALLDASQIIAVALRTPAEVACIHSMQSHPPAKVESADVAGFASERVMLESLRSFMATRAGEQTTLVGHNIGHFDLPRLRLAFLRNGLQLPPLLADPDQPVFDTMREFCRRFSADNETGRIALADVLSKIGLPNHKTVAAGGDVPALFAAGQFDSITRYALLDVMTEAEVFLRLTGHSAALA